MHLEQAQRRKFIHGSFDPVTRQLPLELGQHRVAVVVLAHVNEINNHNAAQIAQAQLTGDRLGGFEIRLVNRFVKITGADKATGVDIHGRQRFGLVNDKVAT